ncbi:MAG: flagellar biosynthetic protein FliO [Spirochaetales bacterium]|nr:flagellar biosynthetic protein FliO [Spirochaetales bacterium]
MKNKFLLILFIISLNIFSQEKIDETTLKINQNAVQTQTEGTNINNPISITDYLMVILVLVFVVGILYFVLRFIKRVGGSRIGLDNDLIHVVSTKMLKGTNGLHLIEVGKQIFLIGATDSSINRIAEITDQETKDMIALNLSVDNVENKSFIQFFTEKLQKNSNLNEKTAEINPDIVTNKEKLERF